MSTEGDVPFPNEVVESPASSLKTTKNPLLTNPLAGDSLLQMTTPLPTLPFELITEILCRLPVKSLVKLKCVCKPWNSLISDSKFTRKHFRMSTMNPNLILKSRKYSPEFSHTIYPLRSIFTNVTTDGKQIKFPFNSLDFHYRIGGMVGSCDGILCFVYKGSENSSIQTVLWNPSIRKYNTLPSLEIPLNHFPGFGFGYDRFTDSYKVVAVFRYKCDSSHDYKTQVKVHTLGTNSWRLIGDFPYGTSAFPLRSSGEFVSGKLNWLVYPDDSVTVRPIVSLDLGTEDYQEILQPDCGEEGIEMVNSSTLGVLRDCLCILRGQDIWLMKEYGNRDSWTKFATVPHLDSYIYLNDVLYISEDRQVLLNCLTPFELKWFVYDSINGTLEFLPDIKKITDLWLSKIYVESLISPCS